MTSRKNTFKTVILLGAILALPACESTPPKLTGGQFWQRISAADALHLQGPKAQQTLHRDIARCVTELRELESLGVVKNAIPTDMQGHVLREDEIALLDWDAPERNKHLFAEHSDYTDFEGCMGTKGWERIEHVPYDTAEKGRQNYLDADIDYDAKDYE